MLCLTFSARSASATACDPSIAASAELSAIDAEARADFLQARLERAARWSRIWTGSWAGVFSALTIGATALAITSPEEERPDYYVTIAKGAVGLASLGLPALRAIDGARWLRKRPRADVCGFVRDGERLLERAARSEADGRSLLMHVGNLALNLGSLVLLGMAFERWEQAIVQGLVGSAVGEAMILSRPRTAERALEAYRAGRLDAGRARAPIPLALVPIGLRDGGGLAVAGSF